MQNICKYKIKLNIEMRDILKNLRKIIPAKIKSHRAAENRSKTASVRNVHFVENDARRIWQAGLDCCRWA